MLAILLPAVLGLMPQQSPAVPPPETTQVQEPKAPVPAGEGDAKAAPKAAKPAQEPSAPAMAKPATATPAPAADQPLSFASFRFPYTWDALIPIQGAEVDGLRVTSIYFNKRSPNVWPLKGSDFGTRAKVEVTNASDQPKVPGFAVAVFDAEDRLLGVAVGGTKFGTVRPHTTETFDMNFHQVLERLPKGDHFYLSIELTN